MKPDIAESQGSPDLTEELLETSIIEKYQIRCWISSEQVGTDLAYDYVTMPGTAPHAMEHQLFVYDNPEPSIPRTKKPLTEHRIATDDTRGDGYFRDTKIGLADYVLGYATGPTDRQIVSMSYIPAEGGEPTNIYPDLNDLHVGISHVRVNYVMAPGTRPKDDRDYIAIKEGKNIVDLYWGNFLWYNRVDTNDSYGTAYINNTKIQRGKSYLLGYYKSDYCHADLACAVSFQV